MLAYHVYGVNASICAVDSAVIDWRAKRPGTGFVRTEEIAPRNATIATAFMVAAAQRSPVKAELRGQGATQVLDVA